MDELMRKWAQRLRVIYDTRAAGAHTFSGVLVEYTMELDALRKIPHHKDCKMYGHDLVMAPSSVALGPCNALRESTVFAK